MKLKINITRRLLVQMALFLAIVGAAVLSDVYFENNPDELKSIQTESEKQSTESGGLYIISQTGTTSLNTSELKSTARKLEIQLHDKFLRKYHQIRNYQVLKADNRLQTAPLIQSYHYLIFQNFFFTQPDDEPLT